MLFFVVLFCSILKICEENKDTETNQFSLIAANPFPCLIWWSHAAPKIVYKKLSATCKLIVICMSSATHPSTDPVCTKFMDGVFQSLDFCLENLEGIHDGDGGDDELGRVMENSRRIFQTLKPRKRCLTEEHGWWWRRRRRSSSSSSKVQPVEKVEVCEQSLMEVGKQTFVMQDCWSCRQSLVKLVGNLWCRLMILESNLWGKIDEAGKQIFGADRCSQWPIFGRRLTKLVSNFSWKIWWSW